MIETHFSCESVDILLIAEGSFPFVKGGVSSWISSMIENLPEYRFGMIFLGAYKDMYKKYLFPIPENLTHLQLLYLFQKGHERPTHNSKKPSQNALQAVKKVHDIFKQSHGASNGLVEPIENLAHLMSDKDGFDFPQFLRSEESWEIITEQYSQFSTDPSFIDYFWNIRNMHEPLWQLQEIIDEIPQTRLLQSVSTGYAGLLGAMLQQCYQYPFILTEHGLYSRERSIELLQSRMFAESNRFTGNKKQFSYQHHLWLNFFDSLARTAYNNADRIISLFEAARNYQHTAGADPAKTLVIPNGIHIEKFSSVRRPATAAIPKIVCYVGRVIRIKDIKTFIRAVAIMISKDSSLKAWIKTIGDEDPEYFKECEDYIQLLGLEDHLEFIYEGDMLYILERTGVLMLSSISEGMPLVVLESMAAGIPVISTDVGSCREIIEGRTEEDTALGKAGAVVPVLDAAGLADAAVTLLNDRQQWLQARNTGIQRAEKYYNQINMINTYRQVYEKVMQ